LSRANPRETLDAMDKVERTTVERRKLADAILYDWAERDPAAAWQWAADAGTSFDLPGWPPLQASLIQQIAVSYPERVAGLMRELLTKDPAAIGLSSSVIAEHAIESLLANGRADLARQALGQWTSTADGGAVLGRAVFESMAMAMARSSPTESAAELQSLPSSSGRNFALAAIGAEWASRDPQAALAWAQRLTLEANRDNVVESAFARWEQSDPAAAAEWLVAQPVAAPIDRLIAQVIADRRVTETNLSAALTLAESISDSRLRCQGLESVARRWSKADPEAAARYISTHAMLSSEEKARILRWLQSPEEDPEN
jgi:hypothetical protein